MHDELVDLTRALVSIPSHDDETAAGEFLVGWLRDATEAEVTRDDAGNVIARKGPADADGDSLALVGHHDVVPPDAEQISDGEYVVEERDGRLYGRGTADMKGALAAMLLAFRDANPEATDGSPAGALVFASFVGEEVGGVGSQHAIGEGFGPDYAVVGEGSTNYSAPGVTDVAVAHRGRRASTIDAAGTAAHAGEAGAGENAIYRAVEAVETIRGLAVPAVDVAGETMPGSLTVTEIEGGSAWNVVPDRCTVTVDERTVPGERAALDQVEDVEGVTWTVDQDWPPMRCTDDAFAEAILEVAGEAQTGAPELVTKPHATDAGWLSEAVTECVIVGPAEPGEAHTADESVSIAVLERCYETYRRVAETWPAEASRSTIS